MLKYLFPNANVPVVQLSLNHQLSLREHLNLASELKKLRTEGILILGSGNITHNTETLTNTTLRLWVLRKN